MTTQAKRRSNRTVRGGANAPATVNIFKGGKFKPLSETDVALIVDKALAILENIGIAGSPDWLKICFEELGARMRSDGRVVFSRAVVEDAIANAQNPVSLPGFDENKGIQIGGGNVHIGTAGAAVEMLDASTNSFRDSTLTDLYDLMRILHVCPNIHYGLRPVVARDMATPFDLDINTAFTCLKGTSKPIGTSFDAAAHVAPVVQMFDQALGRDDGYRKQPFCFVALVHMVPPLRFAEEGVEIMREAIKAGMPLQLCSLPQAGATGPASLAGTLAQGLAESLAGLIMADAMAPGHPCIYNFMPYISDLRTGAMAGGGGEAAVTHAAAAQLLLHLGLPSTVGGGATDSKIYDGQAGYEKGYTVTLAAQAGAGMINLSIGMLGTIMVASPEAMVIDDDMCGAILRSVRGIEVSDDLIDLEAIERVVTGAGHYLGEPQTLSLMKTEYVYPQLADRSSVNEWVQTGSRSVWDRARDRVATILDAEPPDHLPRAVENTIRESFPIKLDAMP